jgi:beta-xylosidase
MKTWLSLAGAALLLGACTSTNNPDQSQTHTEDCSPYLGNPYVKHCQQWETTYEGQRQADLGDGTYLNPIMSGDRPDPSILKDGDDYYMTFSSFEAYPALTIWHSKDLVNWEPVGPALTEYVGSIWAPELTKHDGRYYLYIPAKFPGNNNIYVVYADNIEGPWSDPIALDNDLIDPGHAVGEDGKRYLFLSAGYRVPLSDDGLRITGDMEHVYDAWDYPEHWDVECDCQEGPKIMQHGGYYHMITAVGGTAGPPTGHMVIHARSKSIHGPWEDSPHNPIVRTESAAEKWWSRGHATLVEGPTDGDWYMMYHGYENGYYTLGRQTLMEPVEWTDDGWLVTKGYDMSQPIPKPEGGTALTHGIPLSDDFSTNKFGIQYSFFRGDITENERVHYDHDAGVLELEAKGDSPSNSSPLTFIAGDHSYQFEVDIDFDEGAQAGAMVFYNDKLYAGVGVTKAHFVLHRYGMDQRTAPKPDGMDTQLRMRITNDRHILTIHTSTDGGEIWIKYPTQMEVSGYHHNVAYGFMSLRPALYAAGEGKVRFSNMVYRALP